MRSTLLTLAPLLGGVAAHSWIERATKIVDGKLDDNTFGYARGKVPRSQGWADTDSVWQLPGKDTMCQWGAGDTKGQKLTVDAGDQVALRYLENGHVTMPNVPPGHPTRSGVVFIYATTKAADDDKFADIHRVWNAAGTGGDKRGRLIATRFYDDGQCYESNDSDISKQRKAEFPKDADSLMGAHVWCQNDVTIPEDMSGTVTLYWVWDWPILNDPTQLPFNWQGEGVANAQTYTSCIDINVNAKKKREEHGGEYGGEAAEMDAPAVAKRAMDKNVINTAIVAEQKGKPFLVDFDDLTAGAPAEAPAEEPASSTAPKETDAPKETAVEKSESPATVTVTAPAVTVTAPGQGGATVTVTAPAVTVTAPGGGNGGNGDGDSRPTITRTATTMSTVVVKPSEAKTETKSKAAETSAAVPIAANPVDPTGVPKPTAFMKREYSQYSRRQLRH